MPRPPMSDRAVELLFSVLVDITNGTHRWIQRFYVLTEYDGNGAECGSAYCLAGWINLAAGRTLAADHHNVVDARAYRARGFALTPQARDVSTCGYVAHGAGLAISVSAADLIEITDVEAQELFGQECTLAGLWEISERLSDGRITVPADLVGLIDDRTQTPLEAVPCAT